MEFNIRIKDVLFLFICLALGVLAEVSFLHGRIGLSYLVFISGFYMVILLRFRLSFNHRRIGLLFMVAIWVLSGSYILYDDALFHNLNLLIIPILVFSHITLITSPNTFKWDTPKFITLLTTKLREGRKYCLTFCSVGFKKVFKNSNKKLTQTLKHITIGLALGFPLLFIIIGLLMSADLVFQDVILRLPQFILQFNFLEGSFRFAFIILLGFLFFGIFQVLLVNPKSVVPIHDEEKSGVSLDGVIAVTILVMLNLVYLLFVVIQFQYFFSDGLMGGFTYAEYARRGFFELILIMLINWTILMTFLKFVTDQRQGIKTTINILYSLLIVVSAIMLASAHQRLSMYEAAYGFTLDRLLAHVFMLFLLVIFAYTLIRVWIERLSLTHFYLIVGLTFYTVLNVVNIEQLIVDKNMERYEQTGKIDVYYLSTLSYTGLNGLIQLYEADADIEDYSEVQRILAYRKDSLEKESPTSWQSFNFERQKVTKKLMKLDLNIDEVLKRDQDGLYSK